MNQDKENKRQFKSEEEKAAYYHEVIPTSLGYMTQAEYDRECTPHPSQTEEGSKRWEEYDHQKEKLTSKERIDILKSKIKGKIKNLLHRPKLQEKDRDMDRDK